MPTGAVKPPVREPGTLAAALAAHWPEYLMEAAGLGAFMISACLFGALLEYPGSPVRQAIADPFLRRVLMGLAMGGTSVSIVLSPWGKRSGAHLNPSFTLAFLSLGKIAWRDATFYVAAQFAGGIAGVALAALLLGSALSDAAVNFVVTAPGAAGPWVAFAAEILISGLLMSVVLVVSNRRGLAGRTPFLAGALVAVYITFEAPVSGMSMNPARTFGSAVNAGAYGSLWLYFLAPPTGMFLAGRLYSAVLGARAVHCAKLHHENNQRCIFRCRYKEL